MPFSAASDDTPGTTPTFITRKSNATDIHPLAPGFDICALDSLFEGHEPRLAHMRDAAAFARDLRPVFGLEAGRGALLERSALLHDIGYAPALRRFGYHPLDGALFLDGQGEHPWSWRRLRHSQRTEKPTEFPS
jgi:HD superfamily phosphodiesterase